MTPTGHRSGCSFAVGRLACAVIALVIVARLAVPAFGSAYQAVPKLVVILVIDQFRGDYLDRYHRDIGPNGFRLFTDRGAYFPACYYQYANTRTAPGHATIGTGTYSAGHGIFSNEWWDATQKRMVSSVEDPATKLIGADVDGIGSSPHNLLAGTLGDELRLATQGQSRVYGIALKDRAAILPTGFSANAAFWIDQDSGAWVTSTYYMATAPHWLLSFNGQGSAKKYLNLEWKDADGTVLASTAPKETDSGKPVSYYALVGSTPYANDYEFEFARELIQQEKLGHGTVTDLLVISLSANDILGHQVGPDAPQMRAMILATDRQLADFISFLTQQYGQGQFWVVLTADHGVAPLLAIDKQLSIPAEAPAPSNLKAQLSKGIGARLHKQGDYVRTVDYPIVYLNSEAFPPNLSEAEMEIYAADSMKSNGFPGAFTKEQMASGEVPPTGLGRLYVNSYSPYGGAWVMGVPAIFSYVPSGKAIADHGAPYSYDQHVPLAFYGPAFKPGVYRDQVEPIDLASTLAVMLGINKPTSSTGRVLTEAIVQNARQDQPPGNLIPAVKPHPRKEGRQ
jgi:predicted AlkP superfamily pyrophosphatase or phosphodiesterase